MLFRSIYEIPINFEKFDFGKKVLKALSLREKDSPLYLKWKKKVSKIQSLKKEINIGIVGKYYKSGDFDLKDSYVSVLEAINHSSWEFGVKANIHWIVAEDLEANPKDLQKLKEMDGIIVPQGWGCRGCEGKISAIKYVRENKIPYLGLCYGMQMAVIEYARNVLKIVDATSEEINPKGKNLVIHLMEEQKDLMKAKKYGGTIRLGSYPCVVEKQSKLFKTYKKYGNGMFAELPNIDERHRHRYEFNNQFRELFSESDMKLVGKSPDDTLVEAVELSDKVHPFFVATQYHPELKSRFLEPHPLFLGFVNACLERKKSN